jgi:uncharacterized membrane protein SpoIIM required for sporulation
VWQGNAVDVDAFVAVRSPRWERLRRLLRQRRLTGADADELVALYQSAATDLSRVRSAAPDPTVVDRLSGLLARARATVAGAHEPAWADMLRFFAVSLPAAFYRVRWWTVGAMVVFVAVAVVTGWWTATNPDVLAQLGTPSQRERYATEMFEAYYSTGPASDFASVVWTNNAWIAARAIALGFTGIGPVYLLVVNAVGVGQAGGMLAEFDLLPLFFGLILPHGLMELTAIFVACGAGFKLFTVLVRPGARTRGRAMAEEGRALFTVALGLVVVLAVSAVVEAFVTPQPWPAGVRIAIGALVLAGYWVYTIVLGRAAVRAGETGDVRADHAEDTVAMAD